MSIWTKATTRLTRGKWIQQTGAGYAGRENRPHRQYVCESYMLKFVIKIILYKNEIRFKFRVF